MKDMLINRHQKYYGHLFETNNINEVNDALERGASLKLVFEKEDKAVYIVQEFRPLCEEKLIT